LPATARRRKRPCGKPRHCRGKHEADRDADGGDGEDLDQVDQRHEAARCAEALEGGDHGALGIEEGAYRIGDADSAGHQRGQADQRQELREALDIGRQRRRCIGAVADRPAGGGMLRRRARSCGADRPASWRRVRIL
jgi:hypothetical protein